MHFVSLSGSIFSSYPHMTLDSKIERLTVREELGSGRGYALLQVAERSGVIYTMRLEHGRSENGDNAVPHSGEVESAAAYDNSITIADVIFGREQPFIMFLQTLDKLVQRWESDNNWKRHGNSLSFTLWIAKEFAERDSDWGEDPEYAWIQERSPMPVAPSYEVEQARKVAKHGNFDLTKREGAIPQAGEMESVYPETFQSILSDEETTSELSATTSTTLHSPLDDDVTDFIKAMTLFEAEATSGTITVS